MTFGQMQTDALDLLQEIQNHPQYTISKLKHYLNQGNMAFARKTKAIEGTIDITTVANQFEYDESDKSTLANIYIPYQVRYVDGSEVGDQLKPWPGGYTNLPKRYSYGTPTYYWLRNLHARSTTNPAAYTGVRFGTWPIAGTADKTIRIDAFLHPATLVTEAAEPEYKDTWGDAPVHYAVSRMFAIFSHLNPSWDRKAMFHMSEFERLVSDANQDMSYQSDEPIELEDVYYQMDSWSYA